eukprot:TRINITY_DN15708_c0_g1_i1.p1 TRINITY_DN15708_c0_g1~~TRINITY_DN15708_c0_g1_i1.p1  ORF type:complete len:358 (-),score=80.54 TRINITY_DN15708_c0_g1_i1:77-1150(-)
MKRRNVRTLSLIIVTFTYLLVGAAIFDALEGPNNEKVKRGLVHIRDKLIKKYDITPNDYQMIEVLMEERKPHKTGPQWKFAGSLYYAFVTLALIGYGHSTPQTKLGKMFTVAYSTIGIPLAMIMFQSIGERMNKGSSVLIQRLRTWLGARQKEATEADLLLSSLFFSMISIAGGTALYSSQEGWSYFESYYYCFITLTTIGFGDFVALQQDRSLTLRPGYVVASFCFLLWGLSAVASSVNLLVLKFMTISLEEEEQGEDELHEMGANVVTLEEEVMAANGRQGMFVNPLERDNMSLCSCTCYPAPKRRKKKHEVGIISRLLSRLGWTDENNSDGHYYDSETQSISNYTKLAVKRSSF